MTDVTPRFYDSNGKRCVRLHRAEWDATSARFDDLNNAAIAAGRFGGADEGAIIHANFVRAHRGGEMATMVADDVMLEPLPAEAAA